MEAISHHDTDSTECNEQLVQAGLGYWVVKEGLSKHFVLDADSHQLPDSVKIVEFHPLELD